MARKKPESRKKGGPAVPRAKAAGTKSRARRAAPPILPPAPPPAPVPDLLPGPAPVFSDIPWGYGQTRITAIARDPHCIFAYWEFPDEALERARKSISCPDAPCALRVYETTFRLFDGTNAHGYFDVGVDRSTNRYYFHLGRPCTTFIIDVGVRGPDGRFATIARSGAVETPRDSISGDARTDWMTVPPPEQFRRYEHRFVPKPGGPPPPPAEPGASGNASFEPEWIREFLAREGWSEERWTESAPDGNIVRWIRWSGPIRSEMVFGFPGKTFEKIEVEFQSEPWIVRKEKGERRVFGPWNVAMYAWETRTGRQLLRRWTMHSSWVTEERSIRTELPMLVYRVIGGTRTTYVPQGSEGRLSRESWSSEIRMGGSSEWRWLGGSELRLAGASELMFLAASEWIAGGASEMFAESSRFLHGGSERWGDVPSGRPLFPPGAEKP